MSRTNQTLFETCRLGDLHNVELLISKIDGRLGWNQNIGLYGACSGGHLEIVKFMISKGANNFNIGLYNACLDKHLDVIEFLVSKGANNWNLGLRGACEAGHLDIANLMISKGADDGIAG